MTDQRNGFQRFTQLPKDLRLLIGEASLPGPRVVYRKLRILKRDHDAMGNEEEVIHPGIWSDSASSSADSRNPRRKRNPERGGFMSNVPPPVALLVCRESHKVASKKYTKAFGCQHGGIAQTLFDFKNDTLLLDGADWDGLHDYEASFFEFAPEHIEILASEREAVRNVCVVQDEGYSENLWGEGELSESTWISSILQYFTNLDTLLVGRLDGEIDEQEAPQFRHLTDFRMACHFVSQKPPRLSLDPQYALLSALMRDHQDHGQDRHDHALSYAGEVKEAGDFSEEHSSSAFRPWRDPRHVDVVWISTASKMVELQEKFDALLSDHKHAFVDGEFVHLGS